MLKIGVLASGGGTNLQAIIDAAEAGGLGAEVCVVVSDNPKAGALERAASHGIPGVVVEKKAFPSRAGFDREMVRVLKEYGVELVVLAGFMRLLTGDFLKAFSGRIMNIHPALLPSFPGLGVQKKAIEHGVRFSGCTVHFVDMGCDTGPIIIQAVVPVLADDTPDTLAARILVEEHRIYPRAIRLFSEGRLMVEGRRVLVDGAPACEGALENPPPEPGGP
ncbi:MAG: phosphoribosylglycinamide formyltransferase [Thermodesulfobacteriota bacterium]